MMVFVLKINKHDSVNLHIISGKNDGNGLRFLKIDGLAASASPTGMKNEILLLSWFIVLLRTREDGYSCYDWAYVARGNAFEQPAVKFRLSTDEVIPGLQNTVEQIASAISHHIATYKPTKEATMSDVTSLLLSNNSSYKRSEANDDVSNSNWLMGIS